MTDTTLALVARVPQAPHPCCVEMKTLLPSTPLFLKPWNTLLLLSQLFTKSPCWVACPLQPLTPFWEAFKVREWPFFSNGLHSFSCEYNLGCMEIQLLLGSACWKNLDCSAWLSCLPHFFFFTTLTIVVSSANVISGISYFAIIFKSLITMVNSVWSSTDPSRSPFDTSSLRDDSPLTTTFWTCSIANCRDFWHCS